MPTFFSRTLPLLALPLLLLSLLLPLAAQAESDFSQLALAEINALRQKQGLTPLRWDPNLAKLAADHGAYMDKIGELSHDNFQQRYESADGGVCVENVAWNINTPQKLVEEWENSLQHAENMLKPGLNRAGIARVGYFVTFFACD